MKIVLERIWIDTKGSLGREKGSVHGEVVFGDNLKVEFTEDLLPEELDYIRDGLADLTSRVKERVLNAIRAVNEAEAGRGPGGVK
jgi:hypothetical protein